MARRLVVIGAGPIGLAAALGAARARLRRHRAREGRRGRQPAAAGGSTRFFSPAGA